MYIFKCRRKPSAPSSPPSTPSTPEPTTPRKSIDQSIPSSSPRPITPHRDAHIVNVQCEPEPSAGVARINASQRVANMRRVHFPSSTLSQMDSQTISKGNQDLDQQALQTFRKTRMLERAAEGITAHDIPDPQPTNDEKDIDNGLPPLRDDLFWLSLALVVKPTCTATCRTCGTGFGYPKGVGWRLYGCGHCYHVSCFRALKWLRLGEGEGVVEKKCAHCDKLRIQAGKMPEEELRARIARLEQSLVPYMGGLYRPSAPDGVREK